MGRWFALVAMAFLSACATSAPKTFSHFDPPPASARILVVTPDIQLSLLTAAGLQEPREDWSHSARDNIAAAVAAHIAAHGRPTATLDPNTAMEGHIGQIIRLHDAVGSSIISITYMGAPVLTRRNNFDWTLGPGVQELGQTYNADYALFIGGGGSYASSGRVAAMIGMAVLGVGIPLGGQALYASLVDLHTGNIVWFNLAHAAPEQDMRQAPGASALTEVLMQGAPL